jgi:hypothetical protein
MIDPQTKWDELEALTEFYGEEGGEIYDGEEGEPEVWNED